MNGVLSNKKVVPIRDSCGNSSIFGNCYTSVNRVNSFSPHFLFLFPSKKVSTQVSTSGHDTKRQILIILIDARSVTFCKMNNIFFLRYINHSLIFASLVLSSYLKKRRNRKTMNGGGYRLLRNVLVKFLVKRSHSFVDRNIITILKQMYMVQNNFNCKYQFISTNVLHVRT